MKLPLVQRKHAKKRRYDDANRHSKTKKIRTQELKLPLVQRKHAKNTVTMTQIDIKNYGNQGSRFEIADSIQRKHTKETPLH